MKQITRFVLIPVVALAAVACKGRDAKVDDALNNDLSLAAQARGTDTVSAAEQTKTTTQTQSTRTTPTRTVVRNRSSSSGSVSSSSGSTRSGPIDHVEKHPGRDAAIGAGAGAVIGAATSKDKVKGGIIGAAAGGILGAVIGNNVDKKKVPNK